jgi:hypothetical protein
MKRLNRILAAASLALAAGWSGNVAAENSQAWSDISAGTAMAYCLAKHTGVKAEPDGYTSDGFEVAQSGIIGAVRRNFVLNRPLQAPGSADDGANQTCSQACAQLGSFYGPSLAGAALKYRSEGSQPAESGIGDHASIAMRDYDYYLGETVVAGFWTRPQNFQTEDVAQADHCCCQAVDAPTPANP